jgi:endonuclease V-like protein UPF0215 family
MIKMIIGNHNKKATIVNALRQVPLSKERAKVIKKLAKNIKVIANKANIILIMSFLLHNQSKI